MKNYLLLLANILSFNTAIAQIIEPRTWNWYFGNQAAMKFNSQNLPPSPISSSSMYASEGSSAISDSAGNLLFYTNGEVVMSGNNLVMPNGSGLLGHFWSAQSALLVKKPGNNSLYYLFTVKDWQQSTPGLCYSVIDKSLNGGLGDIVALQKNISVNAACREHLTAAYSSNGMDIWILSHENANNNFVAYLLTSQGLSTTPVVSPVGAVYRGINRFGYMRISPACNKIAYSLGERDQITQDTTVQVFDFNNTTGTVSNAVFLADFISIPAAYGCEFSPDNTKLYITEYNGTNIYQFDLNSSNAAATQTNIATNSFIKASLALGPDGKIYVTRPSTNKLGAIYFPDQAGMACNYTDIEVVLPSGTNTIGICNMYYACSKSTSVFTIDPSQNYLNVFPNPAVDFLTLQCFNSSDNGSSPKFKIKISDLTGRLIFENEEYSNNKILNTRINVRGFSAGIYFLIVESGGNIFLKKVMVE